MTLEHHSFCKGFFNDPRLLNNKESHRAGHTADALRLGTVTMSSVLFYIKKQNYLIFHTNIMRYMTHSQCFLVMLWKYGGFYLDLDYVVFNDLRQFENIVVGNGE